MSQGRVNDINTKRYSWLFLKTVFFALQLQYYSFEKRYFLVASQEIICYSWRLQTKSLTKILDENTLEYLASGKGFILGRLRLEI